MVLGIVLVVNTCLRHVMSTVYSSSSLKIVRSHAWLIRTHLRNFTFRNFEVPYFIVLLYFCYLGCWKNFHKALPLHGSVSARFVWTTVIVNGMSSTISSNFDLPVDHQSFGFSFPPKMRILFLIDSCRSRSIVWSFRCFAVFPVLPGSPMDCSHSTAPWEASWRVVP